MTGTMQTPAAEPALTAAAPLPARRVQKKTDWKRGARLLVGGADAEAVAAALDITEDRLWAQLHRSLRFRHYIRQALERQQQLAHLQFGAVMRASAVRAGAKADALDGALLPPLIAALGLTDPAGRGDGDPVERLGGTGARPPNQAKQRRLRVEIAAMHQEFRALKAIGDAFLQAGDAAAAQPTEADAKRDGTDSKLAETESKLAETDSKLAETDSKLEKTESKLSETESNQGEPASPPAGRPQEARRTGSVAGFWRPDGPRYAPRNDGTAFPGRMIADLTDGAGQGLAESAPPD